MIRPVIPLSYTFDWRVVTERWQLFVAGAWIDIWVAIVGFVLACVLGLAIAVLRVSGKPALTLPAFVYVQVLRGIPLYVFLIWIYFGVAAAAHLSFSGYQAMIITLALTGSGYTAEIFRAGIQAVERGQLEAAHSLGLSWLRTYWHVILPQAFRIVVPPLGNTFIGLFKGATIMSVIAVPDMVFRAIDINVTFFTPFEAFTAVAVLLIAIVLIFSGLIVGLERALRTP